MICKTTSTTPYYIIGITLAMLLLATACSHPTLGKLVGSDRDDHGCLSSAGYTWSYALHDCVRLWEMGKRFDSGPHQVYLVFSTDSTFAEIFAEVITDNIAGILVSEKKDGNTSLNSRSLDA